MAVEAVRRHEEDGVAGREVPPVAKIVRAAHDASQPPVVVRARPVTGALTEPQPSPLPTRTVPDDAVERILSAAAGPEPVDHQLEGPEVTGYATDVPMASAVMTVESETTEQAAVTDLWVHPEPVREEVAESAPAPSALETEVIVRVHFFFSGRSATQQSQAPAREALASAPARTWLFLPLHEPADRVILTVSNRNDVQATVRVRLLADSHAGMPGTTLHALIVPAGSGTELELLSPLGTAAFSLDASAPVLPHRWVIHGQQVHTMSGTPNPAYRTHTAAH